MARTGKTKRPSDKPKKKPWAHSGLPDKTAAASSALKKGGVKAATKVIRGHLASGGRKLGKVQTRKIVASRLAAIRPKGKK